MNIYHLPVSTAWGTAYLIFSKKAVIEFILPGTGARKPVHPLFAGQEYPWLKHLKEQIMQYFLGCPVHFTFPCDLSDHTPFRQKVLKLLMNIRYGGVVSYKGLAEKAGAPKAYRAVGTVMAQNRIPLLIPCHRVIKSNGTAGYFGPGINYKKKLLHLEKII